jgi:hypothetical protein
MSAFEDSNMKKSRFDALQDLAKGPIMGVQRPAPVQRVGAAPVNMGNRASVTQAKMATRQRAQTIRTTSPSAALPKSVGGIKKCAGKKECKECGCDKSIRLIIDAEKGYTVLPPGRARGSESPSPRPFARKTKKPTADTQAVRMKSSAAQDFDMDKFDRDNPVVGSEDFEPMKERPIPLRTSKKPSMEAQENNLKSASKKISKNAVKAVTKLSFLKSLDPTMLPKRGTGDREKWESAYHGWEPKPVPKGYKPLAPHEKKNLNAWAGVGHKQSIHELMDDHHWTTGGMYPRENN